MEEEGAGLEGEKVDGEFGEGSEVLGGGGGCDKGEDIFGDG